MANTLKSIIVWCYYKKNGVIQASPEVGSPPSCNHPAAVFLRALSETALTRQLCLFRGLAGRPGRFGPIKR